ncbi:MAG: hypothetical protein SGILL_009328, partial [Bacillariaceae sp.]
MPIRLLTPFSIRILYWISIETDLEGGIRAGFAIRVIDGTGDRVGNEVGRAVSSGMKIVGAGVSTGIPEGGADGKRLGAASEGIVLKVGAPDADGLRLFVGLSEADGAMDADGALLVLLEGAVLDVVE